MTGPADSGAAAGSMGAPLDHQLRNLLAIVIGYANLLQEEMPPDDPRRNDLQEILKAAERAVALLSPEEKR